MLYKNELCALHDISPVLTDILKGYFHISIWMTVYTVYHQVLKPFISPKTFQTIGP